MRRHFVAVHKAEQQRANPRPNLIAMAAEADAEELARLLQLSKQATAKALETEKEWDAKSKTLNAVEFKKGSDNVDAAWLAARKAYNVYEARKNVLDMRAKKAQPAVVVVRPQAPPVAMPPPVNNEALVLIRAEKDRLEQEVDDLKGRLEEKATEINNLQQEQDRQTVSLRTANEQLEFLRDSNEKLQKALSKGGDEQIQALQDQLDEQAQTIANLTQDKAKAQADVENTKRQLSTLQQNLQDAKSERERIESDLKQKTTKLEESVARIGSLEADLRSAKTAAEANTQKISELQTSLVQITKERNAAVTQKNEADLLLQTQMGQLIAVLAKEKEISDTNGKLTRQIGDLKAQLETSKKDQNQLQDILNDARDDLITKQSEIEAANTKNASLQKEYNDIFGRLQLLDSEAAEKAAKEREAALRQEELEAEQRAAREKEEKALKDEAERLKRVKEEAVAKQKEADEKQREEAARAAEAAKQKEAIEKQLQDGGQAAEPEKKEEGLPPQLQLDPAQQGKPKTSETTPLTISLEIGQLLYDSPILRQIKKTEKVSVGSLTPNQKGQLTKLEKAVDEKQKYIDTLVQAAGGNPDKVPDQDLFQIAVSGRDKAQKEYDDRLVQLTTKDVITTETTDAARVSAQKFFETLAGKVPGFSYKASKTSAKLMFVPTPDRMKSLARALTDPILKVWDQSSQTGWKYWVYTVVPIFTYTAIALRNANIDQNDPIMTAFIDEFLYIMTVALAGHERGESSPTVAKPYKPTVFKKLGGSYTKDKFLKKLTEAKSNTNQYGASLQEILSGTNLQGVPSPLLALIFEALTSDQFKNADFKKTDPIVTVSGNGAILQSAQMSQEISNPYVMIAYAFGLPAFDVFYVNKKENNFDSEPYLGTTIPKNSLCRLGFSSASKDGWDGEYLKFTGQILEKFVDQAVYVPESGFDRAKNKVVALFTWTDSKYQEVFSTIGGRFILRPLASFDQNNTAVTDYNGAIGEPRVELSAKAIDVATDPNLGQVDLKSTFAKVLYELASLDELWFPGKTSDETITQTKWLAPRMAWAHRLTDAFLFTPFQTAADDDDDDNDEPSRSFFETFGNRDQNKVTSKGQFGADETTQSTLSLRPFRSRLANKLRDDSENAAQITLYRQELERLPTLAEQFDSERYHTVLVPSNLAIGEFEGKKMLDYQQLPVDARVSDEDSYVDAAINNALEYLMFEGDIDFEAIAGTNQTLVSMKKNLRGSGLRLSIVVDNKFTSSRGGFIELIASDGRRERAKMSGRVRGKNGSYYVIDRMIESTAAEREASAPNYAPGAAYVPMPEREVSQYANLPLSAGTPAEQVSSRCHLEAEVDALRQAQLAERELAAFVELASSRIGAELDAAYRAGTPLHFYVPTAEALGMASSVSGAALDAVLRTHVGLDQTFAVLTVDPNDPNAVESTRVTRPFTRKFLREVFREGLEVVGSSLNSSVKLVYNQRTVRDGVALVLADFVARPAATYEPRDADDNVIDGYDKRPINVFYVNRLLVPSVESMASKSSASPAALELSRDIAQRVWSAAVANTAGLLRSEAQGDALQTHINALEQQLETHGGASGLALDARTVQSQRKLLTEAISHNDSAEAHFRADARDAVFDLYQRFPVATD